MTKIAYLECPTGIAGDMCLGALISAGVPFSYLKEKLDRLGIGGEYQLGARRVIRNSQEATKVSVELLYPEAEGGQRGRRCGGRPGDGRSRGAGVLGRLGGVAARGGRRLPRR